MQGKRLLSEVKYIRLISKDKHLYLISLPMFLTILIKIKAKWVTYAKS